MRVCCLSHHVNKYGGNVNNEMERIHDMFEIITSIAKNHSLNNGFSCWC